MTAVAPLPQSGCELCRTPGGVLVWSDSDWRVVRARDAGFPAFYRVVAQQHVAEFTDLRTEGRDRCMAIVATVEQVLRVRLRPTKVNLASLGNVVPHLHWHVIARFGWDSHFPQSVWSAASRTVDAHALNALVGALPALDTAVGTALAPGGAAPRD